MNTIMNGACIAMPVSSTMGTVMSHMPPTSINMPMRVSPPERNKLTCR